MSTNRITQTNSRFLYETASGAAPTVWTTINEGYTWIDTGRLFKVTADEGQFSSVAYIAQRTDEAGDYENTVTVSLNVPDGCGLSRVDTFTSALNSPGGGSPDYTTLAELDTFDRQGIHDREAYDQQLELEREIGVIFDYIGSKYRGTITSRTDSREFEPGGFLEGYEAAITTSRKQWADASVIPTLGAFIKVAGVQYKIESVVKNNPHFQLNLTKRHGS